LKKFVTLALAAICMVAFAALAFAQNPAQHTMDLTVSPSDAGTKKKPKNGTANITLQVDPNSNVTVDKFSYVFESNVRVSTKGLKYCTVENITDNGNVPPAKCDKAKVGGGLAIAYLGSKAPNNELRFDTTLFASKSGLTVYVREQKNPDLAQAFKADLRSSDEAGFSQEIVADIPAALEFPAGIPALLTSVQLKFGPKSRTVTRRVNGVRRRVTYRLLSVRGCAANRLHTLQTRLDYADDPRNPEPAPAATEAADTSPCTK
jgi:hypothetical protein